MEQQQHATEPRSRRRAIRPDASEAPPPGPPTLPPPPRVTSSGWHELPEEAYHADPCPAPSLSSHVAMTVISKSLTRVEFAQLMLGQGGRCASCQEKLRADLIVMNISRRSIMAEPTSFPIGRSTARPARAPRPKMISQSACTAGGCVARSDRNTAARCAGSNPGPSRPPSRPTETVL